MYHEMERADFFLPLLDPAVPSQREYLSKLSTGSIQLVMGFLCPAIIHKIFAEAYELDASNAILYEEKNLRQAMLEAMQFSDEHYRVIQQNLLDLSDRKKKRGLANLHAMLLEHHMIADMPTENGG